MCSATPAALGAGPAPPSAVCNACSDVAVKVYRTTLTEFKNRGDYVNVRRCAVLRPLVAAHACHGRCVT